MLRRYLGFLWLLTLSLVVFLTLLYHAMPGMVLDVSGGVLIAAIEPNPFILYGELALLLALCIRSLVELTLIIVHLRPW